MSEVSGMNTWILHKHALWLWLVVAIMCSGVCDYDDQYMIMVWLWRSWVWLRCM